MPEWPAFNPIDYAIAEEKISMTRIIVAITLALALTAPAALMAQDGAPAKKAKAAAAPKVGKDQKVEEGFEFTVYRGDRFVGKVKVTHLFQDLCGAKIIFENDSMEIRQGDGATTRLAGAMSS